MAHPLTRAGAQKHQKPGGSARMPASQCARSSTRTTRPCKLHPRALSIRMCQPSSRSVLSRIIPVYTVPALRARIPHASMHFGQSAALIATAVSAAADRQRTCSLRSYVRPVACVRTSS